MSPDDVARRVHDVRSYFEFAGFDRAVVGVSGGKDSAVALALTVRALGSDNVLGVVVPCGPDHTTEEAIAVCEGVRVRNFVLDMGPAVSVAERGELWLFDRFCQDLGRMDGGEARINFVARVRMAYLRYVTQAYGALLVGTTNASEAYVGYLTKGADTAVDVEPLIDWTVSEVIEAGRILGVDERVLSRVPSDGISGSSDEERLGVSYAAIDAYLRDGTSGDVCVDMHIEELHEAAAHKEGYVQF